MAASTSCPGCGAPLTFRPGTMVEVCRSCKSLCARTDRDPALLGKVAALVDTGSTLALGAEGAFAGRRFSLAGRVQLGHPLGGVWDEWYLAFEDGRWGWLAEAQGRLYLTFEEPLEAGAPAYGELTAGSPLDLGQDGQWVVAERSEGTFVSAEGQIPWRVEPGKSYQFADLSGAHGAFATLDYSDAPPLFFLGREQRHEDLGIKGGMAPRPARVKALSLNCPQCASPLSLRAPDQTLRVGCPSCGSLLDCEAGKLRFLQSLPKAHGWQVIPLGAVGAFKGVTYTCIGALRRSCTVEGAVYPWSEYLLMDARGRFRWLTESDGHWSFVDPVVPGEVHEATFPNTGATWKGRTFRRYQDVVGHVEAVFGECYWKVNQGELTSITEYVDVPTSLSKEVQAHPNGGEEIAWSLSTYLAPSEVWAAFKLPDAPLAPQGIAPHMPNPHKAALGTMGIVLVAALGLLLATVMMASTLHKEGLIYQETFNLLPQAPASRPIPLRPNAPKPRPDPNLLPDAPPAAPEPVEPVFFAGPIEIKNGRQNLSFELSAPVNNAWLGVEGALVNEATGVVELFEVTSSYYQGVDDGEAWSEGERKQRVLLSALPAGSYMLRVAPVWEGPRPPVPGFSVELRSGVMHWVYAGWALAAILFWPLIQLFRVMGFEGRRWSESMYNTTSSSGGGE